MGTKRTRQRARLVCLALLAAVVCVSAQKRISVPRDFPTIQAALGEAIEGDTVFVRNGVYYENITLVDDVVLIGQDKRSTIIDGQRRGPAVNAADGAVIRGFTIRNGTVGVLSKNTRAVIIDNIIMDNKGSGIHALVSLPDIVNNVVYRNDWTGIFLESVRGTRTSISNNVIMENGYSGIFGAGRTEVLVQNNVLMGNKQFGIFLGPESRRTRILTNNIYGNRLPFNENADNQTVRQQNFSEDPQFIGAGFPRHNYALKPTSPLRGKGGEGADIGLIPARTASVPRAAPDGGAGRIIEEPGPQEDSIASESAASEDDAPLAGDMPPPITGTVILSEREVNFALESAEITAASFPVLDAIAARLAHYPDLRVGIAGHTDNQGDAEFNKALSLDRAKAVMDYLVSKGVDRSRLAARGFGMSRPIASNDTEEGRASNRRVEVIPRR